jgi:phenylalanyl-tRNA synthetase beta chain
MRTTLLPGLLETARYNISRKILNLKLFELRKVFLPAKEGELPREVKTLGGLAMGVDRDLHWTSAPRPIDFYDIKGCVEDLLEALQIEGIKFKKGGDSFPFLHPGKAARILSGEKVLGVVGEAHPQVLERCEIPGRAYLFEVDFEQLVKRAGEGRWFRPLPRFPAVYRDLSLVIGEALEVEEVADAIKAFQQPFLDEVNLFDLYRGAPVPEGKKGVSFRIRYQANDRTLTDEEVNRDHEKLISRLREIFQAELRS